MGTSHLPAPPAQRALPILMDEGIVSPVELAEFLHLGLFDGVAMKPSRCGGLVSARQQIQILLDAGLTWLGSGLTDPDVSLAATMGLYTAFRASAPVRAERTAVRRAQRRRAAVRSGGGAARCPHAAGPGCHGRGIEGPCGSRPRVRIPSSIRIGSARCAGGAGR